MNKNEMSNIIRLSELNPSTDEYQKLLTKILLEGKDNEAKEVFLKAIKKIENRKISQENYIAKYKHLKILMYDPETFMPIYKGVKKWY